MSTRATKKGEKGEKERKEIDFFCFVSVLFSAVTELTFLLLNCSGLPSLNLLSINFVHPSLKEGEGNKTAFSKITKNWKQENNSVWDKNLYLQNRELVKNRNLIFFFLNHYVFLLLFEWLVVLWYKEWFWSTKNKTNASNQKTTKNHLENKSLTMKVHFRVFKICLKSRWHLASLLGLGFLIFEVKSNFWPHTTFTQTHLSHLIQHLTQHLSHLSHLECLCLMFPSSRDLHTKK